MMEFRTEPRTRDISLPRLFAYIADLELEVDRLRRHNHLFYLEIRKRLGRIYKNRRDSAKDDQVATAEDMEQIKEMIKTLEDLRDLPGYHPAYDQVVSIAVGPLVKQVFRMQQRLQDAPDAMLHLELSCEHVDWFPARLRHVLDNLISNALKYRDSDKSESWVRLKLRESDEAYELSVIDNGVGVERTEHEQMFDLFFRSNPAREAGVGVGLSVVKMLVEQSGGTVHVNSVAGQGTTFTIVLPQYAIDDYLI